jgi:hypothetical protein
VNPTSQPNFILWNSTRDCIIHSESSTTSFVDAVFAGNYSSSHCQELPKVALFSRMQKGTERILTVPARVTSIAPDIAAEGEVRMIVLAVGSCIVAPVT